MKELKAKRIPLLAKREEARKAGDTKTVLECNAELIKLNLAIQGVQSYEEVPVSVPEAAPKKRQKKAKDILA